MALLRRAAPSGTPAPEAGATLATTTRRARPTWPSFPPTGYLGQLDEGFQRSQAAERDGLQAEECYFYHSVDLPGGGSLPGPWDLRGHEEEYLGGVAVGGRRVLELGPASGWITVWMSRQGAEVVAFEAGYDRSTDLLPVNGVVTPAEKDGTMADVRRMQDSWWFLQREWNTNARMVYGDIYSLPGDLGSFDVAVFGAILLHLAQPFSALAQAAARTHSAIVVVEPIQYGLDSEEEGLMRFDPLGADEHRTNWWAISPGATVAMLRRLGFGDTTVSRHRQVHYLGHDLGRPPVEMDMYTVVGRRPGSTI